MKQKKGRPGGSAPKRPPAQNPLPENLEPSFDCSTYSRTGQGPVSKYLRHGEANSTSTADLVELVGCGTARQLQGLIRVEREAGALILSKPTGGYYLPADGPEGREEIRAYIRTLRARGINTLKAAQAARLALDVLEGQMEVDTWQKEGW